MSVSFKETKNSIPIAKIKGTDKIIYFDNSVSLFKPLPTKNIKSHVYPCPYCKKVIKRKENLIYHLTHDKCPKKGKSEAKIETNKDIIPIPRDEHVVLFVSGPPGSGKTYFVNQYAKYYNKIYDRRIILFTRNVEDETLDNDLYIKILIEKKLPTLKLEHLKDSLVIFDDIESSEYPATTKYLYDLLNDIIKNGRHQNISCIFTNQQLRMFMRTRVILENMTDLVIFPKYGSKYHMDNVMKIYLGMAKSEIDYLYSVESRWVSIRRICPKYMISQHLVYIVGSEVY